MVAGWKANRLYACGSRAYLRSLDRDAGSRALYAAHEFHAGRLAARVTVRMARRHDISKLRWDRGPRSGLQAPRFETEAGAPGLAHVPRHARRPERDRMGSVRTVFRQRWLCCIRPECSRIEWPGQSFSPVGVRARR